MACETFEEIINDAQYVTTQWSATKAVLMKFKLASVFGDALFDIVKGISAKQENKEKRNEEQLEAFQKAIGTLFEKNSPEKITQTLKDILIDTKREGKRITPNTFDEVYNDAGLKEMYSACLFVVKSNYADFFKGQKAGALLAKVEENL